MSLGIASAVTSMLSISHMVLIDFYFRLAPHIFFVLALAPSPQRGFCAWSSNVSRHLCVRIDTLFSKCRLTEITIAQQMANSPIESSLKEHKIDPLTTSSPLLFEILAQLFVATLKKILAIRK